ncbi:MAG: L,D-transpeptidase family protein [Patescibacteria group bacterium]
MIYKKNIFFIFFLIIFIIFVFKIDNVKAEDLNPRATYLERITLDKTIDTDNDGYNDFQEIASGYSPFNAKEIKIEKSDVDKDGLSDHFEIKFKTDPSNPDTDEDGKKDGLEVDLGFNPLSSSTKKLDQRVEITLKTQKLVYYVANQPWKEFVISSGKSGMATPKGKFKILNKIPRAWSKTYKLWMPYWMGINSPGIGIHELPVWPNGYREGASHLGTPVSHGCVRLGVGSAKYIYDRLSVGTEVLIK